MSNLAVQRGGAVRRSFDKGRDAVPVPNLIEVQSKSYNDFAQFDYLPQERLLVGLEKVLRDIFPIEYEEKMSLEYVSYELGNWACTCGRLRGIEMRYTWRCHACKKTGCSRLPYDLACPYCKKKEARYKTCATCCSRVSAQLPMNVDECRSNGQTFSMSLRIKMQLVSWDEEKGERIVRDIKEQDIFFADVPVMADIVEKNGRFMLGTEGTFLINGVDRVVVSQLHRSPGAVFSQSKKIKDVRGRPYYLARIIPVRGSWIDFEFDSNDYLYVRIDKKRKFYVTTFLQALGFSCDEIIPLFYHCDMICVDKNGFYQKVDKNIIGQRIEQGMIPKKHEAAFLGKRITKELLKKIEAEGIKKISFSPAHLLNRVCASDVVDPDTGEVLAEQGQSLSESLSKKIAKVHGLSFKVIASTGYVFQPAIASTLFQDKCRTEQEALKEVHSKIWPGDNSSLDEIKQRLENLFFNTRYYDLTRVGRVRINRKLGLCEPEDVHTLTREDIVATIRYLVGLRERGEGELDDIDHLGNRRVRLVGELLGNQVYIGFLRIERIVRERFRMQDAHATLMPQDLLNVKPLSAVLREFFGTGQLSQFMDQTNPLAEISHKRRLSALGPGGVMKDRATYEIRDVHTSHYGRICPIETPEGQTVGLISSLSTYATVNDLGFIEAAYRPVNKGKVGDDILFLDAFEESERYIAQADAVASGKHTIDKDRVIVRYEGDFEVVDVDQVNCIDLSPKQLVSVSTALIPFLEHDDASRALMGSNMQRQAVPLIRTEAPIVGTGMEKDIAKSSSAVLVARRPGIVEYVASDKIIVRCDENTFENIDDWIASGVDVYNLKKFQRSSYSTWVHHVPIVKKGDRVVVGDVLTNGPSMNNGELALGSNMLVAFMPWHGYNFEDAIVLSKRLVADDTFTSVTIDEYTIEARDTKLGPEEITRDIPNVSETALEALDEDGIIRIGSRVKPGDILVGKVTLKGDIQYSPEEKLLRAIFGEKSREVRDTSLRVSPGVEGMIVDVKIFSRSGIRKDKRYKDMVIAQIKKLNADFEQHKTYLHLMIAEKIRTLVVGKKPSEKSKNKLVVKGVYDAKLIQQADDKTIFLVKTDNKKINQQIKILVDSFKNQLQVLEGLKEEKINRLKKGDPLPSGVIKMVKVYIAMKRPVSVGDKIAGRHGNKGIVSTIVPREDMPYLADGTPVDIVLNPLGVPSRMNVGQILETILGFVGYTAGLDMKEALKDNTYQQAKDQLIRCFDTTFVKEYEKNMGKEGILELARNIAQKGLYFEIPVFEVPEFDSDIKPVLKKFDLPESGAFTLYDGRSGEKFAQPVTVGSIYMMKLNHMVDDKLHARSVGPYSLVTQQPLGGKAQFGGQRLGEMEVWALEAYGAAYALQEMLTYKSDDVAGRHRVYEAIVRGDDIPDPGLPESFNVLIKELQSLALQVDLIKVGKEDVGE